MSLVERLTESRDAFMNVTYGGIGNKNVPIPSELIEHMPRLGIAIQESRYMTEKRHEEVTLRKGLNYERDIAQRVFDRYIGTISGTFLDELDNEYKDMRTLSGGVNRGEVEGCYRVLDAVVKNYGKR